MSSVNLSGKLLKLRGIWGTLKVTVGVRSEVLWRAPTSCMTNSHSWPKFLKLNHINLKTAYLRSFLATWQVNYESFPSDSTYRPGREKKLYEY